MSKIKRLRAVLTGAVASAIAVATLPVLATTAHAVAPDPLGGQAGPVTLSPTMNTDTWAPIPPLGTTVDYFERHPELSWSALTTLPITVYRVEISPNAEFTNNIVTLPNGGLSTATQYDLPAGLPPASYFWRVRGEDAAGHATLWTGAQEGDTASKWQFTKTWGDAPTNLSPANGAVNVTGRTFTWSALADASAYDFQISTNSAFPVGDSAEQTWDCTTNNTSMTPFISELINGEPTVANGTVEGVCGDTDPLMAQLQPGLETHAYTPKNVWYWRVRAIDGTLAGPTTADTSISCFADGAQCGVWTPTQAVTFAAQSISLTDLSKPVGLSTGCLATLPGGTGIPLCYDTPQLTWSANPTANSYLVETAVDPNFSSDYHDYLSFDSTLTPRESFFDNQAGQSYFWRVRACNYVPGGDNSHLNCGNVSDVTQFHKTSPALPTAPAGATDTPGHDGLYVTTDNNQTFSTAVKQVRGSQLTFHWDDLLDYTQQAGIQSTQEARNYRLQYTTTGDWLNATSVDVDATHWTKTDGILPDGGYYWRVAPLDGSGNVLTWSAPATVAKGTVAPTVSIAETGLLAPTSVVNLVFGAPVTGVTAASLGLRQVGGGDIAGTLVWPSTGPTTATFAPSQPLLPGEKIVPWVTSAVVDLAGNPAQASSISSEVQPTVDNLATTISETWSKINSGSASGGSYAKSAGTRDEIRFPVTGSQISILGVRSPDGGYGVISVDGVTKATVSFYAKKVTYGVKVWHGLVAEGDHVVTVTVRGSHPKGSKGNAVGVDAIKVDGALFQQTTAVQAWSRHRSTDALAGSYDAESGYAPAWHGSKPSLTTTFAGTAVHMIGCKSPDSGWFAVYVDGKLKAINQGYQKFTSCNKTLVRITGLSAGTHTMTLTPLGTKVKASTGTKVSVDALVAG